MSNGRRCGVVVDSAFLHFLVVILVGSIQMPFFCQLRESIVFYDIRDIE